MSLTNQHSVSKMICSVLGHRYKVQKHITQHIKEYKCECCGKEVAVNTNGNIVPLTDELKQIHKSVETLVQRRTSNKQKNLRMPA